ncbi:hypothetical protein [Actibacterium sp. 188UL27-1]|uniref:hypothetical protein n=1 Tax=Actibacterium sp. 188UL27-1 TaxID=2786961 RepID=UPI00195859E9|nr:hypothetical protein [Actibacterium sp. 188UL27-1]MBM7069175.1 hypothetical protein [Actibacterium sp. 188UL27-1]
MSSMVIQRCREAQKYGSLTGHVYWPELWMADLNWYDGLGNKSRALVDEIPAETMAKQRELKEAGLVLNERPVADKKRSCDSMDGAITANIRTKVADGFYDMFITAVS